MPAIDLRCDGRITTLIERLDLDDPDSCGCPYAVVRYDHRGVKLSINRCRNLKLAKQFIEQGESHDHILP